MHRTLALDVATIIHALDNLERTYLQSCRWHGVTPEQRQLLEWYAKHREQIRQMRDLKALASTDYQVLNKFLADNGFEPSFGPLEGIGAVSILDILVNWLVPGIETDVYCPLTQQYYPAFELQSGMRTAAVQGSDTELAQVRTQEGYTVWFMMIDAPQNGLDLVTTAQRLIDAPMFPTDRPKVTIPMLDLHVKPDLSWLLHLQANSDESGGWYVSQAFQEFKLRMNEIGAHAEVATGIGMERMAASFEQPLVFDRPFMFFMTEESSTVPLAVAYAHPADSWKRPAAL